MESALGIVHKRACASSNYVSLNTVYGNSVTNNTRFFFCFFFFGFNNIYLVTTLLMTILTFAWRKNKNKVQGTRGKGKIRCY